MRFFTTVSAACLAVGLASAAPPAKRAEAGALMHSYACEHAYWQGSCAAQITPSGFCVNDKSEKWVSDISSFGPDEGFYCVVYENTSCHTTAGARRRIDHPGINNLLDIGWNDRIGSYQCYAVVAGAPTNMPGWNPPPPASAAGGPSGIELTARSRHVGAVAK